ncbi:MAG: hypothetical protein AAF399_06290 [Bacteroidota bacterium]
MQITGTVTFVDLSGGFWGINASDGQKYAPAAPLAEAFQKEGLEVKATIKPVQSFGIFMWGQNVEILAIEQA